MVETVINAGTWIFVKPLDERGDLKEIWNLEEGSVR